MRESGNIFFSENYYSGRAEIFFKPRSRRRRAGTQSKSISFHGLSLLTHRQTYIARLQSA